MKYKVLICLPTFNERENIVSLTDQILNLGSFVEVLVIDDNSPDKTQEVIRPKLNSRLHLLARKQKEGLAKAYLAGFRWALERDYDYIFTMDADFSHRPKDLEILLSRVKNCDVVVGSRYVSGGGIKNWNFFRKLISQGASQYCRIIFGFPLMDWTGGFNGFNRSVLEWIGLDNIESVGYSFLLEIKFRSLLNAFKVEEVPILFDERRTGQSKMSSKIFFEALIRVWQLKIKLDFISIPQFWKLNFFPVRQQPVRISSTKRYGLYQDENSSLSNRHKIFKK